MPMSKAREIAFGELMAAMMFAVQVGLSFLPNIELVSILVIVSTVAFGRITLMSIYAFVLVEGLCYGFGIWWIPPLQQPSGVGADLRGLWSGLWFFVCHTLWFCGRPVCGPDLLGQRYSL